MKRSKNNEEAIDIELGKHIRLLRKKREISQENLAKRTKVSFQQIQKYEKGENRISVSRFLNICEMMDISPIAVLAPFVHKGCSPVFGMDEIALINTCKKQNINIRLLTQALGGKND